MWSLEVLCKAFDGGASTWRLKDGQHIPRWAEYSRIMLETEPHIGDVYAQRPEVWPGQVLNHGLVIQRVASDIDDEPTSLEIQ